VKKILTILLPLLLILPVALQAQAGFDVLDMRSGLPETRIRALCQMPDGRMAIATAGGALAQDIAQQAASTFSSSEQEFLDRLKAVIEQHISDEDFSVQSLSQMMAMDRTVLYRRMHTVTGVSPSVFVKNIRMDIASRLLLDTDLSVCDIAIKTGFSSTKYFSAAFKEVCGVTPSEFRAKKQAED